MSFRQPKSDAHRAASAWQPWIDRHRAELLSIGLPADVFLDSERWSDFLENGHLHWHPSSGFEFGQLTPGQLTALHRFLERECSEEARCLPLLEFMRARFAEKESR